jgi:protein involved in polysaccharide export with SLBB domain
MLVVAGALSACAHATTMQFADPQDAVGTQATRAELEASTVRIERMAASASTSKDDKQLALAALASIRERMRDGDFQVGDRIVVAVQGEPTLSDTFPIRAGRSVYLPNLPEISLQGVLRSELQDYLTKQLAKYVREPVVRTSSLVRLAVLGEVIHPGFYALSADIPLADAIMRAGGPTARADLSKTMVRRGSETVATVRESRQALGRGFTLDQLNVRAGDEIYVGERRQTSLTSVATVLTAFTGLALGIFAATRTF